MTYNDRFRTNCFNLERRKQVVIIDTKAQHDSHCPLEKAGRSEVFGSTIDLAFRGYREAIPGQPPRTH